MRGSYICDLLVNVKLEVPDIPWTTNTPKFNSSWENTITGSITLIIFYNTFFCPPLGVMVIEQSNFPI